jgi:hypothetical protein
VISARLMGAVSRPYRDSSTVVLPHSTLHRHGECHSGHAQTYPTKCMARIGIGTCSYNVVDTCMSQAALANHTSPWQWSTSGGYLGCYESKGCYKSRCCFMSSSFTWIEVIFHLFAHQTVATMSVSTCGDGCHSVGMLMWRGMGGCALRGTAGAYRERCVHRLC